MEIKTIHAFHTLVLAIFLSPSYAQLAPVPFISCDASFQKPCIVNDTKADTCKIKHFRDAKKIATTYSGNTSGLIHAWVSASGVPSKDHFTILVKHIEQITKGKVKKIIDLDLRQESHGYLNNNAINLTEKYNWINQGKTYQQTLSDEQAWLQMLAKQSVIKNVLTPDQFKSGNFSHGLDIPVKYIKTEQEVAEKAGLEYHRFTVTDHMAPNDTDVDRFINLVSTLPKNTWLHIHCRGGNGRATTFFAMYDMLKNANRVTFEEIIKRQASVKPFYDLSQISRSHPELAIHYKERFEFLKNFYQYAQARLDGYEGNWSQWIEKIR